VDRTALRLWEYRRAVPQAGVEFVESLNASLTHGMTRCGAYLNYVDLSLSSTRANELYYGKEVVRELRKLKAVYDPGNIFAHSQTMQNMDVFTSKEHMA